MIDKIIFSIISKINFYININYRFNMGKKHQFKEVEMENGKHSGILKVNDSLNGK